MIEWVDQSSGERGGEQVALSVNVYVHDQDPLQKLSYVPDPEDMHLEGDGTSTFGEMNADQALAVLGPSLLEDMWSRSDPAVAMLCPGCGMLHHNCPGTCSVPLMPIRLPRSTQSIDACLGSSGYGMQYSLDASQIDLGNWSFGTTCVLSSALKGWARWIRFCLSVLLDAHRSAVEQTRILHDRQTRVGLPPTSTEYWTTSLPPQSLQIAFGSPILVACGPIMDRNSTLRTTREIELRCTLTIELARYLVSKYTCPLVNRWCEFTPPGYHRQSRVRMSRESSGWGGGPSGTATLTYKSIKSDRKLTDSLALYESDEHTVEIEFDRALSMLASTEDPQRVSSRARYLIPTGPGPPVHLTYSVSNAGPVSADVECELVSVDDAERAMGLSHSRSSSESE